MQAVILTLFLSLLFCSSAAAQKQDTVTINGTIFLFIQTDKINSEFPDFPNDTILSVYRINNGARQYLLSHMLYTKASDCNNTFTDRGSYTIEKDSIIFITEFHQERNDPIPLKQTQVYRVKKNGTMILASDRTIMHDGSIVDNMKK